MRIYADMNYLSRKWLILDINRSIVTVFRWIIMCNIAARRLVLPGDLQGRSRHVDHDDDDDESNWGGRIKPLLKNLQWM